MSFLSPLTLNKTDKKIENTPYYEDLLNFWFNPNPKKFERNVRTREASAAERDADTALADMLNKKYLKGPGKVLDVLNETNSLLENFKTLGHQTYSTGADYSEQKFDLICAVHTFSKMPVQDARAFLTHCAEHLLADDGHLFIRMPDNRVEGFERDLRAGVPEKIPCFWNLYAFLELLTQVKKLRIIETYEIKPGQRDYVLKAFSEPPSICAGLIVKNEERDLPKCLKSLHGVIDGLVVVDTGSTDRTMQIARDLSPCPQYTVVEQYLEASEPNPDKPGDFQLWDFGKARNRYLDIIDQPINEKKFDFVLWMDADDILLNPQILRSLSYLWSADVHGIQMISGELKWVHHRLWKTNRGVRYSGRCHEYPAFGGLNSITHQNISILHDCAAGIGESSNARNLRILKREVQEAPTARNTFYLANTYKDAGNFAEAIPYYRKRLEFGKAFADEYWFATLYLARCLRMMDQTEEAKSILLGAIGSLPTWAEFWMELAYLENKQRDLKKTLAYSIIAQDMPIPPTSLFRERNKYTDQPYRIASFAAEGLGHIEMALDFARSAKEHVQSHDVDLENRITSLEGCLKKI